tara:strand:+ start:539 stop:934 length:396 start_codon:yes stop_codon:yes gene_type:complete
MSKSNPVGTHNPRPSSVNHALWLILVSGLTIELALVNGSVSFWFSIVWMVVGLLIIPAAIYGSCKLLRGFLLADAMLSLTILMYFLTDGPESIFAMGILAGQTVFAVYLTYLVNRQILEYQRLEMLHNELR